MEGAGILPNRSDVGDGVFSPWADRISLVALIIAGVALAPDISSAIEPVVGEWSMASTACGLVVIVPLISTWIGKLYVRVRT